MLNKCAESFTKLLESDGLKFQTSIDNDGDSVINMAFDGKSSTMFFSGEDGKYFSIYLVYERVPENKFADAIFICNELNRKYKWVTFYVDNDADIMLHNDAILSVDNAAGEAFELFLRMIKISDDVKPKIMKALYA